MDRHSSFISIWFQLEICAMAVLLTKGEIRCYCDAPYCVATGYMCKSPVNACFTKVVDPHVMNSPLTHGCVDPVATSAGACVNVRAEERAVAPQTLQCCHDDMCNYQGLSDLAQAKGEYTDHGNRHRLDDRNLIANMQDLASAREVWFRAAVIAVPVAGGLILAMLVVLALRMLRSENRRLGVQRRQRTLAHLQRGFPSHRCGAKNGRHSTKMSTGHPASALGECADRGCPVCDKMPVPALGSNGFLSLVHWEAYRGFDKQEFV